MIFAVAFGMDLRGGKTIFVKAREEEVVIAEKQNNEALEKNFSYVEGEERLDLSEVVQKKVAKHYLYVWVWKGA